jgi:chaperone modulatory protein CbpM
MSGYTVTVTTMAVISRANPLATRELAQACGTDMDWVRQLVEVGIVEAQNPESQPDDWRFDSADLQHALEARQLERDFGVALEAAALILDLQHEVRRLKAVLHAREI